MKRCAECGFDVEEAADTTYNIYLMYQVVDIYECKEAPIKEIRTQKIKYICRTCRTSSDVWKSDDDGTIPWKEI